jgi:hypothetical protein
MNRARDEDVLLKTIELEIEKLTEAIRSGGTPSSKDIWKNSTLELSKVSNLHLSSNTESSLLSNHSSAITHQAREQQDDEMIIQREPQQPLRKTEREVKL